MPSGEVQNCSLNRATIERVETAHSCAGDHQGCQFGQNRGIPTPVTVLVAAVTAEVGSRGGRLDSTSELMCVNGVVWRNQRAVVACGAEELCGHSSYVQLGR